MTSGIYFSKFKLKIYHFPPRYFLCDNTSFGTRTRHPFFDLFETQYFLVETRCIYVVKVGKFQDNQPLRED